MSNPAEETKHEVFFHGWLPLIAAVSVLGVSVIADVSRPGMHWAQRAGSVVTVLGAYVAYRDVKQSVKFINGDLFINPELWYRPISMALVIVGTLVWGYGDLVL